MLASEAGVIQTPMSSVEITKNTKGTTWCVKVYVLPGEELVALTKARALDEQLRALYEPKEEDPHDPNN